jgi:5,10-methylenetetrahydromethanopterin reductase
MQFAINRLDLSGPLAFAESAARAESLGWAVGFIPCSPLLVRDPYVMLAFAAQATERIVLGTMLDTPMVRHPSVLASSIATVAELAPGRTVLGLGIGDTAVRLNGLTPAKVATLERAIRHARSLLAGEAVDVGAAKRARLRHAAPVPVWVAAQGPKSLRMAGATCDGIMLRVGRNRENLKQAYAAVVEGAEAAGRDPGEIDIGLILHTIPCDDVERAQTVAKSVAAGFYEYSPHLFALPGIEWMGPNVEDLKKVVWPDFHHARDLDAAGHVVSFLPTRAADEFALYGTWDMIAAQLRDTLSPDLPIKYVLPHPLVLSGTKVDYLEDFAEHVFGAV